MQYTLCHLRHTRSLGRGSILSGCVRNDTPSVAALTKDAVFTACIHGKQLLLHLWEVWFGHYAVVLSTVDFLKLNLLLRFRLLMLWNARYCLFLLLLLAEIVLKDWREHLRRPCLDHLDRIFLSKRLSVDGLVLLIAMPDPSDDLV